MESLAVFVLVKEVVVSHSAVRFDAQLDSPRPKNKQRSDDTEQTTGRPAPLGKLNVVFRHNRSGHDSEPKQETGKVELFDDTKPSDIPQRVAANHLTMLRMPLEVAVFQTDPRFR